MLDLDREIKNFDAIKVLLASPEDIIRWSRGEVTKPETINYRTSRTEVDGLMCEKIFGPTKNFQCYCGKYRKPRYKGIVCDKCGVEVTLSKVRRERMGHIKLVVPVTHIWYAHSVPSKLSILLNIPQKDLRAVIYYTRHLVVSVNNDKRRDSLNVVDAYEKSRIQELNEELEMKLEELKHDKVKEVTKLKENKLDKEKHLIQSGMLDDKYKKLAGMARRDVKEQVDEVRVEVVKIKDLVKLLEVGHILTDEEQSMLQDMGVDFYIAMIGAQAIERLLKDLDLEMLEKQLRKEIVNSAGKIKANVVRRLKYVSAIRKNNIKPEWMILHVVPVIPPDLRPIISLPGGRYAVSDLNDLYRRVINRNNRLKRLIEINAPEVILRNEKRMLQESVDSLLDNGHTPHKPVLNSRRLPYKSLTDQLRGKKGLFRRNLLGKRVDYSGRAVIIGDPTLRLYECGVPRHMALELFRPFVIRSLISVGKAINIQEAKLLVNERNDVVWDELEKVLIGRPVLLNRPPTLHKQSIQGFFVRLVDGNAIRLHPLVCGGFNADFDGDQMGIFVPLGQKAIEEVKTKMLPKFNILKLANGESIISLSKDMVWGIYYLTSVSKDQRPRLVSDINAAMSFVDSNVLSITDPVITNYKGRVRETTVGRLIFNDILPKDHEFINDQMTKNSTNNLISKLSEKYSRDELVEILDKMKDLAFKYATISGFTIAKSDLIAYSKKAQELTVTEKKEAEIFNHFNDGMITEEEKERLVQELWLDSTERLAEKSWKEIQTFKENHIYLQIKTKTSGSIDNLKQVVAIKGLVRDPSGKWVNLPIKSNYTEGLSVFEFFIAARGGRKGLADTALRTADSGYLTRKLVDVAHSLIIREEDCGYKGNGIALKRDTAREIDFLNTIKGRTLAKDVVDSKKKVLAKANDTITKEMAQIINDSGVKSINVRSLLTCKSSLGVCAKCYGHDMGTNQIIELGKAVGVIASQSIGEASTQMTLRTFHFGGSKAKDITQGVPKLVELFEARTPKYLAKIAPMKGRVKLKKNKSSYTLEVVGRCSKSIEYIIDGVREVNVKDGDKVKKGDDLFVIDKKKKVISVMDGTISIFGKVLIIKGIVNNSEKFRISKDIEILVKNGDSVTPGQQLTEGAISPKEFCEVRGLLDTQIFILEELQKVYKDQGIPINDKHLEGIIREMGRTGKIIHPGDSHYIIGAMGNRYRMDSINDKLIADGKSPVVYKPILLGITATSLSAEGILSALSFQEQVRVLTDVSLRGNEDDLIGLKENVIIGRLIPTREELQKKNKVVIEQQDSIEDQSKDDTKGKEKK